ILDEIVERTVAVQGAVVTGRGMALSTALETALKLKETCYLHTMGMSYADFLHGPIAVADPVPRRCWSPPPRGRSFRAWWSWPDVSDPRGPRCSASAADPPWPRPSICPYRSPTYPSGSPPCT